MQIREALVMAIAEIQLILADSQPFGNYTSFFFHLGGPSQKRLFFSFLTGHQISTNAPMTFAIAPN
tara:strand:+ start:125 stop:322 length:198 start_codon:yes stop_codon:yes gene_type:complete